MFCFSLCSALQTTTMRNQKMNSNNNKESSSGASTGTEIFWFNVCQLPPIRVCVCMIRNGKTFFWGGGGGS